MERLFGHTNRYKIDQGSPGSKKGCFFPGMFRPYFPYDYECHDYFFPYISCVPHDADILVLLNEL